MGQVLSVSSVDESKQNAKIVESKKQIDKLHKKTEVWVEEVRFLLLDCLKINYNQVIFQQIHVLDLLWVQEKANDCFCFKDRFTILMRCSHDLNFAEKRINSLINRFKQQLNDTTVSIGIARMNKYNCKFNNLLYAQYNLQQAKLCNKYNINYNYIKEKE